MNYSRNVLTPCFLVGEMTDLCFDFSDDPLLASLYPLFSLFLSLLLCHDPPSLSPGLSPVVCHVAFPEIPVVHVALAPSPLVFLCHSSHGSSMLHCFCLVVPLVCPFLSHDFCLAFLFPFPAPCDCQYFVLDVGLVLRHVEVIFVVEFVARLTLRMILIWMMIWIGILTAIMSVNGTKTLQVIWSTNAMLILMVTLTHC